MCGCSRLLGALLLPALGCARSAPTPAGNALPAPGASALHPAATGSVTVPRSATGRTSAGDWLGFDRNEYPGDAAMATLHGTFAFTGYWLTNPPGESANTWAGKRALLKEQGWGFLVLANGRLDAEILKSQANGTPPAVLAHKDAATAVASAQREGFPAHTILFLDQEEGGRLLAEQAAYLLGWTEAVATTGFRPGVYASGQQVEDSPGQKIDTIEDVRARVKAGSLHEIAIFDALDQCPPAPGCTLAARPLRAAPDPGLLAWQYAQSPRRPEITKSCAATYAADGNCYAPGSPGVSGSPDLFPDLFLDMNVAASADPSNGR